MKKIGVLGGTFDPVHIGHISLALDVLKQAELDEIIFMPAKIQPFKIECKIAPSYDRVEMLEKAIANYEQLSVSTIELDREEISYTYRSLELLKESLGLECKLYFISGTDTYLKMDIWKEAEKLLRNNSFIVGQRPGYKTSELMKCKKKYKEKYGTETKIINNERKDISATEIRDRIGNREKISHLVTKPVEDYIYEKDLYI